MRLPKDKVAFAKPERKEPEKPAAPSELASALEGIATAVTLMAKVAAVEKIPADIPAPVVKPVVNVTVPERPKKWLFTVGRGRSGQIETINAEALD